jgi:predicted MPP superfamily phosphohydrolase
LKAFRLLGGAAALAGGGLAWGHFEAGWVRLHVLALTVPGLPRELSGLRVAHLSDFHLGHPGRGGRAVHRAVEWVEQRRPDVVVVTGDLLSRRTAEPELRGLLSRLPGAFVILGNHDFAISRDPFSERVSLTDLAPARLLSDGFATADIRGVRVSIAGLDPRSWFPRGSRPDFERLVDPEADFRILLTHSPRAVDRLRPGWFQLVVAGHMHGGQINVPYGRGKLRLAHPSARYTEGVYRTPAAVMHVSRGLGTTFVPFRFLARPEATELVLEVERDAPGSDATSRVKTGTRA